MTRPKPVTAPCPFCYLPFSTPELCRRHLRFEHMAELRAMPGPRAQNAYNNDGTISEAYRAAHKTA